MPPNRSSTTWVIPSKGRLNATVRLFCIPYGGGGVHIFQSWPRHLPDWIDVRAIQGPGRGSRLNEAPITTVRDFVESAAAATEDLLDLPFAFFV